MVLVCGVVCGEICFIVCVCGVCVVVGVAVEYQQTAKWCIATFFLHFILQQKNSYPSKRDNLSTAASTSLLHSRSTLSITLESTFVNICFKS